MDISQVPAQFDPAYVQGLVSIADTFHPQANDALKYIPLQPGGSVAAVDPRTNTAQMLIAPNDGSHPVGAPAQNMPRVTDQASYDAVPSGAQYMTPDGQIRVKGGQSPQGSGGFR